MDETFFNVLFIIISLSIPLICLASIAFWVWMLVDCLRGKLADSEKTLWVLVIIFGNLLGAIIYFFVGKDKK